MSLALSIWITLLFCGLKGTLDGVSSASVDVIWQSCEEARQADAAGTSFNVREVPVDCKMQNSPVTEELKITANGAATCNHSICEWFYVNYTNLVSMDSVTKWMNADNRECWQEIRYSCLGAPINDSRGIKRAFWVNGRGGYPGFMTGNQTHWCECAMYDTCIYPDVACNCDKNDMTKWVSDSGIVKDKSQLPVGKYYVAAVAGMLKMEIQSLYCQPEPNCPNMNTGGPLKDISAAGVEASSLVLLSGYAFTGGGKIKDILYVGTAAGGEVSVCVMRKQSGMTYEVIHVEKFTAVAGPTPKSYAVAASPIINPGDVIAIHSATKAVVSLSKGDASFSSVLFTKYHKGTGSVPAVGGTVTFGAEESTEIAMAVRIRLKVDSGATVTWKYNGTCMAYIKEKMDNFTVTSEECAKMNAVPLSISTPEKQSEMVAFLSDKSPTVNVSIGLKYDGTNRMWTDSSPQVYSNFAFDFGMRKALACNGSVTLSCSRQRIIRILYAHYGRTSHLACLTENVLLEARVCRNPASYDTIVGLCQNKPTCTLKSPLDGDTNCPNTNNYVEVHYDCITDDKQEKCTVVDPKDNHLWKEVNCNETKAHGLCQNVPTKNSKLDCITVTSLTAAARCPAEYPDVFGCLCPCSTYVIFPDPGACVCHCTTVVRSSAVRCCKTNVPPHAGTDMVVYPICVEELKRNSNGVARCNYGRPTAVSCTHSGTTTPTIYEDSCVGDKVTSVICCRQKIMKGNTLPEGFEAVDGTLKEATTAPSITLLHGCSSVCAKDVKCKSFYFNGTACKTSVHPVIPNANGGTPTIAYEKPIALFDVFSAPKHSVTMVSKGYDRHISTIVLDTMDTKSCLTSCMELKHCSMSTFENNTCHVNYSPNGTSCRMLTRQVQEKHHVAMAAKEANHTFGYHTVCKTVPKSTTCPEGTLMTSCSCLNGTLVDPGPNVSTACSCNGGVASVQCCRFQGMWHNAPVSCAPGQMIVDSKCEECHNNATTMNWLTKECQQCPADKPLMTVPGHHPYCDHCDFHWIPAPNGTACVPCPHGQRTRLLGQMTCENVDCGDPPTFNYSVPAKTGTGLDDNTTYTCEPGYNMTEPVVISCNFNTTWTTEKEMWDDAIVNCTEINECESDPCLHEGNCTDEVNMFSCQCAPGYTGTLCETDIDECESTPCLNGATCGDKVNGYECSCVAGYTGSHCETDIDDCESSPCLHGATCGDQVNAYECSCAAGYTGIHCETDIDECSSSPCLNSGTCGDLVAGYNCSCVEGYVGTHCETEFDECSSSPCQHEATCTDAVASYSCSCPVTYTGVNCETEVDECTSTPCQNGAQCQDFLGFYNCTCLSGFNGTLCEINIDECASDPCIRGNCTDQVDSYICECPPGYTGAHCETEIDECASFPCKNNGICEDKLAEFKCTCATGYTGDTCETSLGCGNPWPLPGTDKVVTGTKPGDNVTYKCASGMATVPGSGSGFIRCSLDGMWKGEGVACRVVTPGPSPFIETKNFSPYECRQSPEDENAMRYGDGVVGGSMITYVCKGGYLLSDGTNSYTRVCDNYGKWSKPVMKCGPVKCPAIEVGTGTIKSTSIRDWNTVVEVYCLPGYGFFDGTDARSTRCMPDGKWLADVPLCKKEPCPTTVSTNAKTVSEIEGVRKDLECETTNSFFPSGRNKQSHVCIKKSWMPPIKSCGLRCPAPPYVENTTTLVQTTDVTTTVSINCILGHRYPDGQKTKPVECLHGFTWMPYKLKACKEIFCPPVPTVTEAVASKGFALIETNVTYTCSHGKWFVALRSNTGVATCLENATWVNVPSSCQDIRCGPPPFIKNANNDYVSDVYNRTVKYNCNGTFRFPFGETLRSTTCLINGSWSIITDTCEDHRCPPVPTPNNTYANTRLAEPDTVARISCLKGHEYPDKSRAKQSTCNGNWSVYPPPCAKVQCPLLNKTSYRMLIEYEGGVASNAYGAKAVVKCSSGFMLNTGKLNMTTECTDNGEWSIPLNHSCVVLECPAIRPVPYCTYATTANTYGSLVKYSCKDGFSFPDHTAVKVVECLGTTKWSEHITGCDVIKCVQLPTWDTYDFNSTDNTIFNTVEYRCSQGYNFTDGKSKHITRCFYNKFWYPPFKSCKSNGGNTDLGEPKESTGSASLGAMAISIFCLITLGIFLLDVATIGREALLVKQNLSWLFKSPNDT